MGLPEMSMKIDQARSRAYRWNEDGLGGICDRMSPARTIFQWMKLRVETSQLLLHVAIATAGRRL
jgi:hypothetical protein